jgi:type I restriction enzyme M protein
MSNPILATIFKDPDVQHGLSVFEPSDVDKLVLADDGPKATILCRVSGRHKVAKPEEIIRQLVINTLVDDLGYPLDRLAIEVKIKMGSTYASKAADLVVYTDKAKLTPYIIVEIKKPKRKDGLDQLQSYMNATGVYYGAWINGNDEVYQLRADPNLFEVLRRLPAEHERLEDVKTPITKQELTPIEHLKDEVEYLEQSVLANAGVSAFDEIFKLIFTKLYDELTTADDAPTKFRTTTAPPREQYDRLNGLFHRAAKEWPDIFSPSDDLELSPEALVAVASAFESTRFFDANLDVIDAAFEYMINPEQKGDRGQFFTPRPVVKMCVHMLDPKTGDRIIDPACGPGGFLIHSLNWVVEHELRKLFKEADIPRRKLAYATQRLFGIDFDVRLARVAKAMMLIAGDGRTNIYRVNSLDGREWEGRSDGLKSAITDDSFDVIMTNPPFAGNITQPEILGGFDLAYKGDPSENRRAARISRDLLFIERCVQLLKPGGRMAVVLPQGTLNNISTQYVHKWLMARTRILATVGLHGNTFKPFTNTKTSVLFAQKMLTDEALAPNYPIFCAVNKIPLKDTSGSYIYKRDADGGCVLDADDRPIVDHDLDDIAAEFRLFCTQNGIGLGD